MCIYLTIKRPFFISRMLLKFCMFVRTIPYIIFVKKTQQHINRNYIQFLQKHLLFKKYIQKYTSIIRKKLNIKWKSGHIFLLKQGNWPGRWPVLPVRVTAIPQGFINCPFPRPLFPIRLMIADFLGSMFEGNIQLKLW